MPNLYHSKLQQAKSETGAPEGHNRGNGHKIEIEKKPGGGYHTKSHHHDGHVTEEDHQNLQQVTEHMGGHFGEAKPMREKNPKMRETEPEPEQSSPMPGEASLSDLGVEGGE